MYSMRCLVTEVAGFIGSHLAERLLAEGLWGAGYFASVFLCLRASTAP